jgi:hypothetical protein
VCIPGLAAMLGSDRADLALEYLLPDARALLRLCPVMPGVSASTSQGPNAGSAYLVMEAPGWGELMTGPFLGCGRKQKWAARW